MKSLFWTKIPDKKVDATMWDWMNDDGVELEVQPLVSQFSKKVKASTAAAAKSKPSGPVLTSVLDPKRQQNAGIALARLRMPFQDVAGALLNMDEDVLTPDIVNLLDSLLPTDEESSALDDFLATEGNTIDKLAKLDQFMLRFARLPRAAGRLHCLKTVRLFESTIPDMGANIGYVRAAVTAITCSPSIRELLRRTLALGNYLNGGTNRGAAYGFKLDSLLKLDTVKSNSGKQTLLHFLVRHMLSLVPANEAKLALLTPDKAQCEKEHPAAVPGAPARKPPPLPFPDAAPLALALVPLTSAVARDAAAAAGPTLLAAILRDLRPMQAASRVNLDQLRTDFASLKRGLDGLKDELEAAEQDAEEKAEPVDGDQLLEAMGPFEEDASEVVSDLDGQLSELDTTFKSLVVLCGEEASKTDSETFFGLWSKVGDHLRRGAVEVADALLKAEREAKKAKK